MLWQWEKKTLKELKDHFIKQNLPLPLKSKLPTKYFYQHFFCFGSVR